MKVRNVGEWRSLVAHLLWEQRVAGSNPAAPTNTLFEIAPVAQGIEHRPSKPGVAGSNPAGRAMSHASSRMNGDTLVDVAQLVEPRIVIPAVVGSSPIVHPILSAMLGPLAQLVEQETLNLLVEGSTPSRPTI